MKITSVCCHLSIVLRFEMRILLSFLFVLFYGMLFNNLSVNGVCVMMMSTASMMTVTMLCKLNNIVIVYTRTLEIYVSMIYV